MNHHRRCDTLGGRVVALLGMHTHTMYAHNVMSARKQHVEHSTRSLHLLIVILNPCISNTQVSWFQLTIKYSTKCLLRIYEYSFHKDPNYQLESTQVSWFQ